MKKFLIMALMFMVFALGIPFTADAHPCPRHRRYSRSHATRTYRRAPRYSTAGYAANRPSFYRRHRNLINIGIATSAGALVGGLIGGRRGAGLGLLGGAGAGALYTYKLNPKRRRY